MAVGNGASAGKHAKFAAMSAMKAGVNGSVKDLAAAVWSMSLALEMLGLAADSTEDMLVEIRDLLKKR
jgi:hypothetical protein